MHARATLWVTRSAPSEPGPVALVSQSGNVAVNALATKRGLRFHTVIASGNQAVLGGGRLPVRSWRLTVGVGAIAMYLEDDGGPPGCATVLAALRGRRRAGGRPEGREAPAGLDAAAAHSAALAGDQRIFRALIEEAGGRRGGRRPRTARGGQGAGGGPARALAAARPLVHAGWGIMTCSGGDSAQAADEAARLGLELPALAPANVRAPARAPAPGRHRGESARLHRDDLGRGRAAPRARGDAREGPRDRPGARVRPPVSRPDRRGGRRPRTRSARGSSPAPTRLRAQP